MSRKPKKGYFVRGQHSQQLSRAELGQLPALESGQGLLGNARARGDLSLLQAKGASSCGYCRAQFQNRLHLTYLSIIPELGAII